MEQEVKCPVKLKRNEKKKKPLAHLWILISSVLLHHQFPVSLFTGIIQQQSSNTHLTSGERKKNGAAVTNNFEMKIQK